MLRRVRFFGFLLSLAGSLGGQPACKSEEPAVANAAAIDQTTVALTSGDLVSVNGTYTDCRSRAGAWSIEIAPDAVLDHGALSVVLNDDSCKLTLTSLHADVDEIVATPPISLTTTYPTNPSAFGSPVAFYASAKLSTVLFASDFSLTIVYSNNPNLVTATNTAAACRQATVGLGSAATFAVLGATTVTNTGSTVITGDLGVSPGTAVTGFPPGTVTHGTIHLTDSAAGAALADFSKAYSDAGSRTLCPIALEGDLGGQILKPGLYRSGATMAVTSANLTLDAMGEGSAVFIFQMGSTLLASPGRRLILINGASSANIYWQVGSSATLDVSSSFAGTIMADQSITLDNGATLDGRALALNGAVTMDGNTVAVPGP